MIRIMSAFILALTATVCSAAEQPIQLADNAPEKHIVVKGDTLWGISAQFLKEPWRWPEIWRMNREQIKNPNLIYPGDVIVLDRDAEGKPILRVMKKHGAKITQISQDVTLLPQIYFEKNRDAIPPIPPNVIGPFLSEPLVVEANGLENAARIVATQQDRVMLGKGDLAYVENADPSRQDWQVYRRGKALLDPAYPGQSQDNPKYVLGYEAFYLGTAKQTVPGNLATFEIKSAKEEIGRGDRLLPSVRPQLEAYIPHKPDFLVEGRIVSVYGGVDSAGRGSIVSLSRGSEDGLEIGHVLAIERNRTVSGRDEYDQKTSLPIPPERVGLVFVFRTFNRISYGLIVQSEGTIDSNDFVRTP